MFKSSLFSLMMAASLYCILPAQGQNALPEGNGKQIVQTACSGCHALDLITRANHSRADWQVVLDQMTADGAPVPKDQIPMVLDYLTKSFPEKPAPQAVVIPGSAKVNIKEWTVPTPGSRPHDPLATPDGYIWYTGHMASVLGRLDPKTGQIKEFHPKTPNSGPHGLTFDKAGNIWYTGNFKGYIGKLNPETGEFTEYKLPPGARDPHTPIFDQKGTLWFSVQGANMVGRLVPSTGDIKVVTSPTPKSNPYGMVVTTKGVPIFCEFGAPKIASIDPNTMEIHEWTLPHEDSRPRRIAIDPSDNIWYADYSRGYLGHLDTTTGKVTEYPSPGGPKSQPYGIVFLKGEVWYSESAVKPNTLVRFDPKTEKFQTWVIPSGGGVVRNMMVTRDGNIAMAESGINKVALAEIAR
jgi:virginiamycin B lyase